MATSSELGFRGSASSGSAKLFPRSDRGLREGVDKTLRRGGIV